MRSRINATINGLNKAQADIAIAVLARGTVHQLRDATSKKELQQILEECSEKLSKYISEHTN